MPQNDRDLASNINAAWEEAEKAEAEEAAVRGTSQRLQRRSASPSGTRKSSQMGSPMKARLRELDAAVLGEVKGSLMGGLLHHRVSEETEEVIRDSFEEVLDAPGRQKGGPPGRPKSAPRSGGRGRVASTSTQGQQRRPSSPPAGLGRNLSHHEISMRSPRPDGHPAHGHEPRVVQNQSKPSWMRGAPQSPPLHSVHDALCLGSIRVPTGGGRALRESR
jgi:hypothetical protein